jgi:hypothetical protein
MLIEDRSRYCSPVRPIERAETGYQLRHCLSESKRDLSDESLQRMLPDRGKVGQVLFKFIAQRSRHERRHEGMGRMFDLVAGPAAKNQTPATSAAVNPIGR